MKDFHEMTADEVRNYTGAVYRATVQAWPRGQRLGMPCVSHDFNSTTPQGLNAKIQGLRDGGWTIRQITEGPHTADAARRAIEDQYPVKSMGL